MNQGYEEAATAAGQRLAEIIRDSRPLYMVVGEVIDVDEAEYTTTVIVDTDRVFSGIELNVLPNAGNSILLVPAVGSLVILGFLEGLVESPILLKTTQVSQIIVRNEGEDDSRINIEEDYIEVSRGNSIWKIEKDKVTLSADAIEYNGGDNGGTVLIRELTNALNNFANAVSGMVNTYNGHTHTYAATTTAGTTAPTLATMTPPPTFNAQNYENTKITQ